VHARELRTCTPPSSNTPVQTATSWGWTSTKAHSARTSMRMIRCCMRLLDLSIISISPMPGGGFQWPVTIITTGAPLLADFMTGEGATTGAGDGGATKSFEADASDSASAAARWFFGSCPLRVLGIQAARSKVRPLVFWGRISVVVGTPESVSSIGVKKEGKVTQASISGFYM